jgi:hypothetical protein
MARFQTCLLSRAKYSQIHASVRQGLGEFG